MTGHWTWAQMGGLQAVPGCPWQPPQTWLHVKEVSCEQPQNLVLLQADLMQCCTASRAFTAWWARRTDRTRLDATSDPEWSRQIQGDLHPQICEFPQTCDESPQICDHRMCKMLHEPAAFAAGPGRQPVKPRISAVKVAVFLHH